MKKSSLKLAQFAYEYTWILLVLIILITKSHIVLLSIYKLTKINFFYSVFTVAPLLMILSISFLFVKHIRVRFFIVLDLIISILFIIDIIYGRAFESLISLKMLFAKNIIEDLGGSILSIINPTDFLLLIDIPILYLIAKSLPKEMNKHQDFKMFLFSILVSVSLMWFQYQRIERNVLGDYRLYPLFMSPIGYHMFDLTKATYDNRVRLDNQDINTIESWLRFNEQYQVADEKYSRFAGIIKGKNIIAIQFESLENFLIGKSLLGHEITPNINKLLKNSIYFDNVHEQVNLGNSSDAELLFNTSIYPINNGSTFMQFSENTFITLPNLLKSDGYNSIAIHGDNKEYWNRDKMFPTLGFDDYISENDFMNKTECGMGILDENLFSQTISEIEKLNKPFYTYLITITSHMPFDIDNNLKFLNLPDNISSNYLQSIFYTDRMFGEFYDQLAINGLLEDSIIVIYGDHEGIHKYYETDLPSNNHEIPFIIHIPNMAGTVIHKTGGQIDMMPTLVYMLGVEKEKYTSKVMGRNLFCSYQDAAILQNGDILGHSDDNLHLANSVTIADLIIKGNYFSIK